MGRLWKMGSKRERRRILEYSAHEQAIIIFNDIFPENPHPEQAPFESWELFQLPLTPPPKKRPALLTPLLGYARQSWHGKG